MRKLNVSLWVVQGFLALFFALASGAPKLLLPFESLPMPVVLPEAFVKFIGVCEVLGALGLILPGATRILPGTTVVAAAMLALLTVCATVAQLMGGNPGSALFATGMGMVCALTAYGRWRMPLGGAAPTRLAASAAVSPLG